MWSEVCDDRRGDEGEIRGAGRRTARGSHADLPAGSAGRHRHGDSGGAHNIESARRDTVKFYRRRPPEFCSGKRHHHPGPAAAGRKRSERRESLIL